MGVDIQMQAKRQLGSKRRGFRNVLSRDDVDSIDRARTAFGSEEPTFLPDVVGRDRGKGEVVHAVRARHRKLSCQVTPKRSPTQPKRVLNP